MDESQVTVRWQIELPLERAKELEDLMSECGISKKTEFLNNAYSLFKWAIRHVKAGRSIAAVNEKENKYTELEMPVFSVVRKNAERKEQISSRTHA